MTRKSVYLSASFLLLVVSHRRATRTVEDAAGTSISPNGFGDPGGSVARAHSINDRGKVAGYSEDSAGTSRAFYWSTDTGMIQIESDNTTSSNGIDINAAGEVLGTIAVGNTTSSMFLWHGDGGLENLENLSPQSVRQPGQSIDEPLNRPQPVSLSDSGRILGHRSPDMNTTLGFIRDASQTIAEFSVGDAGTQTTDMNERSEVVGMRKTEDGTNSAFVWSSTSGMVDLGALPGFGGSHARSIHAVGEVVGYLTLWSGPFGNQSDTRAFEGEWGVKETVLHLREDVWQTLGSRYWNTMWVKRAALWKDGTFHDLNELVEDGSGLTLYQAFDINNKGQIVGIARMDKEFRAFLLTPIEEADED